MKELLVFQERKSPRNFKNSNFGMEAMTMSLTVWIEQVTGRLVRIDISPK
jgi:hypothetical protein